MALWIAILLLPVAGLGKGSPPTHRATSARPYYTRCPNLSYKGRHKLFRHALTCSVAKGKAIYVLKHRNHPPGWHCSLSNLADGYGACARGARAFEFLPV